MTTLQDRPNTALLVIDVQNGVVREAYNRSHVITNIATAIDTARQSHVPVVWVQHSSEDLQKNSKAWQLVPELLPESGEPRIEKRYGDAFEETDLEDVLEELHIGHLVILGAQTDACIRSTIHGAFTRGYDATLVTDAHTTDDQSEWGAPPPEQVIAHTNLYWTHQSAPGRIAATVETKNLAF